MYKQTYVPPIPNVLGKFCCFLGRKTLLLLLESFRVRGLCSCSKPAGSRTKVGLHIKAVAVMRATSDLFSSSFVIAPLHGRERLLSPILLQIFIARGSGAAIYRRRVGD